MWFRLLGPVEVEVDGRTLTLRRRQERCLLAALVLRPGRLTTAARLEELLWEANPPENARRLLYGHIARVRAMLHAADAEAAGVALESSGPGYVMRVSADQVDALRFRAMVAEATGRSDPAGRDELLREALSLWRGPALHNAAAGWVRDQLCADLDELRLHAVEASIAARIGLGRHLDVISELAALTAEYPDRQRLAQLQMTALHRTGRTIEALAAYTRLREHLVTTAGLDPGPELVELHQEILRDAPPVQPPGGPNCLPRDINDFTGRADLLARIAAMVPDGPNAGPVVVALDGMPGVGKTSLAVHLAHRLAAHFPDGQLALDLHGHSQYAPVETAAAIQTLLRQLGVPGERIPDSVEARTEMWRNELVGRRVFVLLDNAGSSVQVEPLLPTAGGCLALVTSRRRLAGLDGVTSLTVDVLSRSEAVALMQRVVGDRIAADPAAAGEVVRRCGNLTLAVRLAAARLAHRPGWTARDLATRLGHAPALPEVSAEGRTVRAAFSLSYRQLSTGAQRLYRLLGLAAGADISTPATASLAGLDLPTTDGLLTELVDAHLLDEPTAGRYRLHDLLHEYAAELVEATDPEPDRRAALGRQLDLYLHSAIAAVRQLEHVKSEYDYHVGEPLTSVPDIESTDVANAWYAAEHRNLVAAVAKAAEGGWYDVSWKLTRATWYYLYCNGFHDDWTAMYRHAVRAAVATGNQLAEAMLHNYYAGVLFRQSRWDESLSTLDQAAEIQLALGDRAGYMTLLVNRARVYIRSGRPECALPLLEEAHAMGVADAAPLVVHGDQIANIGLVHLLAGRYDLAEGYFREHLRIAESLGSDLDRGGAYSHLGELALARGQYAEALSLLQTGAELRRLDDTGIRASVICKIGSAHRGLGDLAAALERQQEALRLVVAGREIAIECEVRIELAKTLGASGEHAKAIECLDQARTIAERIRHPRYAARAMHWLAQLLDAEQPDAARAYRARVLATGMNLDLRRREPASPQA